MLQKIKYGLVILAMVFISCQNNVEPEEEWNAKIRVYNTNDNYEAGLYNSVSYLNGERKHTSQFSSSLRLYEGYNQVKVYNHGGDLQHVWQKNITDPNYYEELYVFITD